MTSIASLPADQRAVLELVLRRGRTYDEIAELLSIDRAGVRQRALAAFDALGPKTRVPASRRALIADYLLEALPNGVADEVRDHLQASATERAWARAVASELEELAERPLPEIPTNGRSPQKKVGAGKQSSRAQKQRAKPTRAEVPVGAALSNGTPRERPRGGSRVGGAVLLGVAAAVAVALVLVFVVFSGGSGHKHPARAVHHGGTTSHTTSASSPKILSQVNLLPPSGAKSPVGIAYVVKVRNQIGMLVAAQGLKPNTKHPANYYAIWLYNSAADNKFLGLVTPAVGSNGEFRLPAALPSNATHFQKLLVTIESGIPKKPGQIVLQGSGKL